MAVPNSNAPDRLVDVNKMVVALHLERSKFTSALVAENTKIGYRYDQSDFRRFGASMGLEILPASTETLSLYVTSMLVRGLKTRTCGRRVAAVLHLHRSLGLPAPPTEEIHDLLRGARRMRAEKPDRVLALRIGELRAISVMLLAENSRYAIRNRAMILTGFTGALRNANTAGLMLSDLAFVDKGVELTLRKSKTDQEGRREQLVGLPYTKHVETDPVIALKRWLACRGDFAGPIFTRLDAHAPREQPLLPERIGQIVRQSIEKAGYDSRLYGGHSLRSGMITEAGLAGVGELLIGNTSGHRDMSTLRGYFRKRDVWEKNIVGQLDL